MIKKVFIDLDDTLNSMTIPALRSIGCRFKSDTDYAMFPIPGSYDIVAAANSMANNTGLWKMAPVTFWESLDRKFWANLPPSPQFVQIIDFSTSLVGYDNVCILTAPTLDPLCSAGKVDWIQEHIPDRMQRQFLIGPRKRFCASPDSLLIDDCDANISEFRDCGGRAITVPRPWNSLHRQDTSAHLQCAFKRIFEEVTL